MIRAFQKKDFTIFNSENPPVLNRIRNTSDGLWDVTIKYSQPETPLATTTTPNANSVLRLYKTKYEPASYLHSVAGFPTQSTFIRAINNVNFITWPVLT